MNIAADDLLKLVSETPPAPGAYYLMSFPAMASVLALQLAMRADDVVRKHGEAPTEEQYVAEFQPIILDFIQRIRIVTKEEMES